MAAVSGAGVTTGDVSAGGAALEHAATIKAIPGIANLPNFFKYLMPQLLPLPPRPTVDEDNCQPSMALNPNGPNHRDAPMGKVTAWSVNYRRRGLPSSAISLTRYEQNPKFRAPGRNENGGRKAQCQVECGGHVGCPSLSFRGEATRNLVWGGSAHPQIPLLPPKDRNDTSHFDLYRVLVMCS